MTGKQEPCHKPGHNGNQHPFQVVQGITGIEQIVTIIIMRTLLAVPPILLIVLPAIFMRGVLALHYNLIACLKGRLTEIARL